MTEEDVIRLLDKPDELMRKCMLSIAGGGGPPAPNGQAVIATFQVSIGDKLSRGFTTGLSGLVGRKKDRPTVQIVKLRDAITPAPKNYFNAYYIPMVQVSDVGAGSSHYSLPTKGNCKYMITSRLTGCVFSMGSAADGSQLVSHVQPPKGPANTLDQRQSQAVAAGATGFNGASNQVRHGKDYDLRNDYVAIIGKRYMDGWKFFMQKATAVDSVYEVRSAAAIVN